MLRGVIDMAGSVLWVDGTEALVLDFFRAGAEVFCERASALRFGAEGVGEDTEDCWRRLPLAYLPARGLVGMAGTMGPEVIEVSS